MCRGLVLAFAMLGMPLLGHAISDGPLNKDVNMAVLLADPGRFDGKIVRFYAFCTFGFEESSLYVSPFHAEVLDLASEIPISDGKDYSTLHGKWVRAEGIFRLSGLSGGWPRGVLESTEIREANRLRRFTE